MGTIAVTGASGFVGGEVCRRFVNDTRGIFRRDAPNWTSSELRAVLEGACAVIHAASIVHRPELAPEEVEHFNVEGTRELVAAARAARVRRFVFVSSIKVHGECPPNGLIDEHTPIQPENAYARTKVDAERIVLDAMDLNPVVLRLCPVYGRGDKGNVRAMIRNIQRRTLFIPGDGSTRKSIVHVSTVASLLHRVATASKTGCFVVSDRATWTIREIADEIARVLGRRRPFSVPRNALVAAARVVERTAQLAHVNTRISPKLIEKATSDSICDSSLAERTFDVDCHVELGSALRDEIEWLRTEGML